MLSVSPKANAICCQRGLKRRVDNIASGSASGRRYRAEPAKKSASELVKKMSTHWARKSRQFRAHQIKIPTPIAMDAQKIGLKS